MVNEAEGYACTVQVWSAGERFFKVVARFIEVPELEFGRAEVGEGERVGGIRRQDPR